jgi:TonB family protein
LQLNLLTKLALQPAGFPLANHFNQSLTLKRIKMMKMIKKNVKNWKIGAIAFAFLISFFIVACQDQVIHEIKEVAQNSVMALEYPEEVRLKLEELKKSDQDMNYQVVELNKKGSQKLADLEKTYGPKLKSIYGFGKTFGEERRTFVIIGLNEEVKEIIDATIDEDQVFRVVEESAQPVGGWEEYYQYISDNIKYTAEAGVQGSVYVEFVVQENGSVADIKIVRGIGGGLDEKAARLIADGPKWDPAKHRDKNVKQRIIMPIKFSTTQNEDLAGDPSKIEVVQDGNEMVVSTEKSFKNGKTLIKGFIVNSEGKPLPGANVVNVGTNWGTVSNIQGEFIFETDQSSGKLSISFVEYEKVIVNY